MTRNTVFGHCQDHNIQLLDADIRHDARIAPRFQAHMFEPVAELQVVTAPWSMSKVDREESFSKQFWLGVDPLNC